METIHQRDRLTKLRCGRPACIGNVRSRQNGFTLIEVILALAIAAGILMVVLFFYRQSENLRNRLLEETTRISAVRLVLDRLSQDLQASVRSESASFNGTADRIQFLKLDFPQPAAWTDRPGAFETPFCTVTYSLGQSTNGGGLTRSEESLGGKTAAASTNSQVVIKTAATQMRRGTATIAKIQYMRLRYWDGKTWADSWTLPSIPAGVEVSLGTEPLPAESTTDEYPFDLFRRVIYLPSHSLAASQPGDTEVRQ